MFLLKSISTVEELWDFLREEINKFVAFALGSALIGIITFFKRIPKFIGVKYEPVKELVIFKRGSLINNILGELAEYSGAIYIHIIRYHNGKKQKGDMPVHWDKMSVEWEDVGRSCDKCVTKCRSFSSIKKVQWQWQKISIENDWRVKLFDITYSLRGKINTVHMDKMDEIHQSIWSKLGIGTVKEIYIKSKNGEAYTLALSFCKRFEQYPQSDGMMMLAAKQLRNII